MLEIDGSFLEGGGQILRTAAALSAVLQKPCRVFNIRKGRSKSGLMTQHLVGIRALSRLCDGHLEGDEPGSEEIKFYPGKITGRNLKVKIETAGSITLVLQSLVLPALFAAGPVRITFEGGATDTFFSPTIDHFRCVFLKILGKMVSNGKAAEINVLRRGYYPAGGAEVEAVVYPSKLKSLDLIERGGFKEILAVSGASESLKDKKVAERQMAGAREVLRKLKLPVKEKIEYSPAGSPGSRICLAAEFENTVIGADRLGSRGKRAEDVGKEAVAELLEEEKTGACLDKHLADQILPYLALAPGQSRVTVSAVTAHCQTNVWVIEKFISGKFEIRDRLIAWQPG